ncbi:N-6 DNA methylase [Telmatocola sphagniphila]|uniref:site-specific DNA-methyltransferase (adenine-specific) n=1 Tax=Telmatocola sphagniphila TaxID=1123043 RepID=A0A8E6B8L6_9BACT|nr:N-6 DNA methylase [Telmatocola sphagniphila]QVL33898.1 N-6 DNA methylase [Telmatocola sphagniphila]
MAKNDSELEPPPWHTAEEKRDLAKWNSSEYAVPFLGLLFLRYAELKFLLAKKKRTQQNSTRRPWGKKEYHSKGIVYLPSHVRFSQLLMLPETEPLGNTLEAMMEAVESHNPDLKGALPRNYSSIESASLRSMLQTVSNLAIETRGERFGKIFEYFLSQLAPTAQHKGGSSTPNSLAKLIVEILEPNRGKIFDPCCGLGGMFISCADYLRARSGKPPSAISFYGQERVEETRLLARLNLAVHGLCGDIRPGNTYYDNPHNSLEKFDFVLANPPFNEDQFDKEKVQGDPRLPFGKPRLDNANYLWIQLFYSSLNSQGRAGFVMANSAAEGRQSDGEIRNKLLQTNAVDVIIAIGPNFFYTGPLPCSLWFLDKAKAQTSRKDQVLFIDARSIFQPRERTQRQFSPKQIEFIANIVRLYRGEKPKFVASDEAEFPNQIPDFKQTFPKRKYTNVPRLCQVATLKEIETQAGSLNPARYVTVAEKNKAEPNLTKRLRSLSEELKVLNKQASKLEKQVAASIAKLLEKE